MMNLYKIQLSVDGENPGTWLYSKHVAAPDMVAACNKALEWATKAHHGQKLAIYKATFEGYVL
jgi:hypothetical protein